MASRLPVGLTALLLAGVVLAGCTEPQPSALHEEHTQGIQHVDEDDVDSTTKPLPPEQAAAAVLVLHVTDTNEQPVPGAFVSVTGSAASGSTNATGDVRFDSLAPGTYHLRLDADLFLSQEANVTLRAGEEKTVTLRLEPIPGYDAGGRGHFHDYWNGATEATILKDETWDIRCYATYCYNSQNQAVRNFALPPGSFVYPGTGAIELSVKWSSAATQPIVLAMGGPGVEYTPTKHAFATSGESWRFNIKAENTDPPHAQTSRWFVRYYETITENKGVTVGPLVLTIKIFRGDYPLPFDPPHPDEWAGATKVRILERSFHYGFTCYRISYTGEQGCQALAAAGYGGPAENFFQRKVLTGTSTLEVRITFNTTTLSTGQGVAFEYIPGRPSSFSTYSDVWERAPRPTIEGTTHKFTIAVDPGNWDPFYAKTTLWKYRIVLADDRTLDQGALVADLYVVADILKGTA